MDNLIQIKRNQNPPVKLTQTRRRISLIMDLMRVLKQLQRRMFVSFLKGTIMKIHQNHVLKKKKEEKKGVGSEMEHMISQLTAIVRELEEHELQNLVEVLGEDRSDEIDSVIAIMICLAKTIGDINNVPENKPF